MNSRGAVKHRLRRARVVEPTISPDSLLEGNGFDKLPLRDGLCRLRDRSRSRKRFILSRQGTESSNLICSSGESANHGLGQARVPADATRVPRTGRTTGACPGYVKDHVLPLACGGPDAVSNLQWQTIRDTKAKDEWERKGALGSLSSRGLLNTISTPSFRIGIRQAS